MCKKLIIIIILSFVYSYILAKKDLSKLNLDKKQITKVFLKRLNDSVNYYWSRHNLTKASQLLQEEVYYATILGDSVSIAKCYSSMGSIFYRQAKYKKCKDNWIKALNIYKSSNKIEAVTITLGNLATLAKTRGFYKESIEYALQCIDISLKNDFKNDLSNSYNILAGNYKILNQNEKALDYYIKSVNLYTELKKTNKLSKVLNNIGNTYKAMNSLDSALHYYKKSLKLKGNNINNDLSISIVYNNIGKTYLLKSELDSSEQYLLKSLFIKKNLNNKKGMVITLNNLGELFLKKHNYNAAFQHLNKAKVYAEDIKALDLQKRNYDLLHTLYYKKNDFKKSLKYYEMFSDVKDSILTEDKIRSITEMTTRFETQQKEYEIEKLNLENRNKDLKIQHITIKNRFMTSVLTLIVIALIPLFFFIRQRNKNRILKTRLDSENKECTRIAKELHDDISGSITQFIYVLEKNDVGKDFVKTIAKIGRKVRSISHKLNLSSLAQQDLKHALSESLMLRHFPDNIKLQIDIPEGFDIYDYDKKINIIRILQELMTNSMKHSEASLLIIKFAKNKSGYSVEYADNGIGCEISDIQNGNGLFNIEERVKKLKAQLSIITAPDEGFYCRVSV